MLYKMINREETEAETLLTRLAEMERYIENYDSVAIGYKTSTYVEFKADTEDIKSITARARTFMLEVEELK